MYRDRGGVGSSAAGEMLDRKRINDALDKHLEKSSPSTSKNKGSAVGKHIDPRNNRSSDKNKCSDVLNNESQSLPTEGGAHMDDAIRFSLYNTLLGFHKMHSKETDKKLKNDLWKTIKAFKRRLGLDDGNI